MSDKLSDDERARIRAATIEECAKVCERTYAKDAFHFELGIACAAGIRALAASPAPAISESEDAKRLDWLTDRLEDAIIDGADPAKYLPDDVGDGNEEGATACRRAWRLAIDAARKGEKS